MNEKESLKKFEEKVTLQFLHQRLLLLEGKVKYIENFMNKDLVGIFNNIVKFKEEFNSLRKLYAEDRQIITQLFKELMPNIYANRENYQRFMDILMMSAEEHKYKM